MQLSVFPVQICDPERRLPDTEEEGRVYFQDGSTLVRVRVIVYRVCACVCVDRVGERVRVRHELHP